MQRSQKNSCMGQTSLEIGCLAPHRHQAEPQLLGISQTVPSEGCTAFRAGRLGKMIVLLCGQHCSVRVGPQKSLYREPSISVIMVTTTTIFLRLSWVWAPQCEQKHLWGGKGEHTFPPTFIHSHNKGLSCDRHSHWARTTRVNRQSLYPPRAHLHFSCGERDRNEQTNL